MPLIHSASKKNIGKNIKKGLRCGESMKQAQAVALNVAREAGAKIPRNKKK